MSSIKLKEMKRTLTSIALAVFTLVAFYAAMVFVIMEVSPTEWTEPERFCFVWFGSILAALVGGFNYFMTEPKSND
jgi:glucan phosphoethanolaminetransferase (alkaline phosphatase superfamily)